VTPDDRTVYVDPDHTLLIPRPAARGGAPRPGASPPTAPKSGSAATLQRLVAGINPLLGAASQLLALVSQLRATTVHADRPGLRRQLLERMADFEDRARASGVGKPQVAAARYLLCTFIDEVIANTPWGADPLLGAKGLLQEFHEDASGADKAFELLDRLSDDVGANADLLELFYVCLALGFQGRYAGQSDGPAQLQARMDRLLELVRPGAPVGGVRVLAQRWAGETRQRAPALAVVPIWMAVVVGAALVVGVLMFLSTRLNRQAEGVMQQLHEVRTALRVDRAPAVAKARLSPLLQGDIQAQSIEVRDEAQRSVVTLDADRLFAAGTAQLEPARRELLARIARSLAGQPGRVEVIGHTDDRATESLRFPSNWHLSRERAAAVRQVLVEQGVPADRARAEGRADVEPRVPNDSDSARARNRRVEIHLLLPRPE